MTVVAETSTTGTHGVDVLISTYNPQPFIGELLRSVLDQDYPAFRVRIRDDGTSCERSKTLLRECAEAAGLEIEYGEHLGVVVSFLTMLGAVPGVVQYTAFCDQDDVWFPGKLSRAIAALEEKVPRETPGLYCSRYIITDRDLKPLAYSPLPRREPSFGNALVQNIAAGFTIVLNRPARLVIQERLPQSAAMHDWWCYLVISGLGTVVYDPEPTVLYRQHADNAIGEDASLLRRWSGRLRRLRQRGKQRPITDQAAEFLRLFGCQLDPDRLHLLESFVSGRSTTIERLAYALRPPVYRQSPIDDLILRLLLALNRV